MGKLGKKVLVRILIDAMGVGIALVCMGWVLWHLVTFFNGYVFAGEGNKVILLGEVAIVSFGLLCFLISLYRNNFHIE